MDIIIYLNYKIIYYTEINFKYKIAKVLYKNNLYI